MGKAVNGFPTGGCLEWDMEITQFTTNPFQVFVHTDRRSFASLWDDSSNAVQPRADILPYPMSQFVDRGTPCHFGRFARVFSGFRGNLHLSDELRQPSQRFKSIPQWIARTSTPHVLSQSSPTVPLMTRNQNSFLVTGDLSRNHNLKVSSSFLTGNLV